MTPEKINLNYNNFYEFSTSKHFSADGLKIRPWTVTIDGLVEKAQTFDVDALIKAMGLEERLYRHRCVEAWSMAIPWTGFPLRALVEKARPLSSAKYVRFESFLDKKDAPGQRSFMPWPYVEGLTIAEATNDLAFVATGAYGKPLAKVQGAPIRLATPWKYGFKSAKSIVKISFVDTRPATFWETLGPDEYGFWANVNPDVPHPRWSQAKETFLTDRRVAPDAPLQRLRRCRSPGSTRAWRKSRSTCASGAWRSVAPALRLGDEEVAERLHARDVLHLLGVDEEAIHLRHVRLRQQPHQAGIRRHAIVRQHRDADAVLDGADDRGDDC